MADVEKNEPATEVSDPSQKTDNTITADDSATPPSYNSIYSRLQSVKEESTGPKDFLLAFTVLLCGSVIGTVLIGITFVVPLTMIIIGAIHLKDCPVERYIPIYLIVGGCFGIVQTFLTTCLRVKNKRDKKEHDNARPNPGSGIISCFLLSWFIAGSVWVYRAFDHVNTLDPSDANYCHPGTYWFAFVLLTMGYISIALSCCVVMCSVVCYAVLK